MDYDSDDTLDEEMFADVERGIDRQDYYHVTHIDNGFIFGCYHYLCPIRCAGYTCMLCQFAIRTMLRRALKLMN